MLGPVLFTLYTTPLSTIISSFDINPHLYADDTLHQCLMGVSAWMTGSKLKLNPRKTEFLLIGTKLLHNSPCLILGQDTNPSSSTKNLGEVFDSGLNFRKHISQTCSACFYHIRDLRRIRKRLTLDLAKQNAVALVSSS